MQRGLMQRDFGAALDAVGGGNRVRISDISQKNEAVVVKSAFVSVRQKVDIDISTKAAIESSAQRAFRSSARSVVACDCPPALALMCLKEAAEFGSSGDAACLDAARHRRCISCVN
jgi:hypothetical protein